MEDKGRGILGLDGEMGIGSGTRMAVREGGPDDGQVGAKPLSSSYVVSGIVAAI